MLRCVSFILLVAVLLLAGIGTAEANSYAGLNLYGYPLTMGPGGSSGLGIPGESYTYVNNGLGLSDVTSRYGVINTKVQSESQPLQNGYFGPELNGIYLGVSYGFPQANHDAATTSYARDMVYEASLDNACIAFPGFGVGSLGLSTPSVNSNKANVRYAESVQFQLSTESDSMSLGGFGYPLGLGLGYSGVGFNGAIGTTGNSLGVPFYYS